MMKNPFITFTTPSDDAVGVETSASLSVTFNEPIVKGMESVVITESLTNVVHERINVKIIEYHFYQIELSGRSQERSKIQY